MEFIERIKAVKSAKKITNEQLARMTGIPLSTLSKILAGFSESPKLSNVAAICEVLDISIDYIVSGIPENTNNYTLEPDEMRFIEEYRKLDRHGREIVSVVLDKENERLTMEVYRDAATPRARIIGRVAAKPVIRPVASGSAAKRRLLPYFSLPVSAGIGEYLDSDTSEEISIPDNARTADANFALRIAGDSMEPKYRDGDILLVERCDMVNKGEAAIYILDGDGYFKIYGGDRLISLNPKYEEIPFEGYSDIYCAGRVIGKLKRK